MKIIELQAENFKGLKAVEIKPGGNVVEVTGKNGSGKTSVLDALWIGLAGAKGIAQPIRNGADKARIKLDMGELVVERIMNGTGSKLTVSSPEGARYQSPQRMLNELLGALTFDPMAFAKMKPADQKATLCELLGIDLAAIDYEIDGAFEERKQRAALARETRAAADAIQVEGEAPADVEDLDLLLAEITQAMESNAAIEARSKKRQEAARKAKELREQASRLRFEAEALEGEAEELEDKIARASALPNLIDVPTLKQRLAEAQGNSKAREQWALKQRYTEEAEKYEKNAAAATAELEKLRQKKADLVNDADMPVPELGIGEDGVTYNGVPFAQASTAQRLRASCALAMAQNPDLRVLRIEDGNDLDEDNLSLLAEMADDQDYQVWIERIQPGSGCGVQIVNGEVA